MVKRLYNKIQNLSNFEVLIILIVVALASVMASLVNGAPWDRTWWAEVSQGLVTEMIGALATFWLINLIFEERRKREEEERALQREREKQAEALQEALQHEKERLIRELGSSENLFAKRAAEELWKRSWSQDGSLRGVILNEANLQKANFWGSDLQGIWGWYTNFQSADFYNAKLQEAQLRAANLQKTRLWYSNLQSANLAEARLEAADMTEANLQWTRLEYTSFDENTILPDGTHWTPDTDLCIFTDPTHPQFWRSDNPHSPAYRGDT